NRSPNLWPSDPFDKIIRQTSQQIEGSRHGAVLFPQDDLIPSPKDLHFFALQSKLLRQPDRLTVSGTKNPCSTHAPTSNNVYTTSIHAVLRAAAFHRLGFGWSSLCNRVAQIWGSARGQTTKAIRCLCTPGAQIRA